MMRQWTRFIGRAAALGLASLTIVLLLAPTPRSEAAESVWEPTGLTEQTMELLAPASGAFFARTLTDTLRSDDGGASWRSLPLPPAYADNPNWRRGFTLDPADHTRMFVGPWVTHDDGVTWSHLGSWPIESSEGSRLALSPADPNLLYVAFTHGGMGTGSVRFLRSRDGGESWEKLLTLGPSDFRPTSVIDLTLFQAHYSDPNVMFQSVVGITARDNQGVLRRSADQGTTLQEVLFKPGRIPRRLVGGRGIMPGRFYCSLSSSDASRELHRSDDDGITWTRIAEIDADQQWINGLDYDPMQPDHVYIAVNDVGVRRSEDSGQTWTDLGLTDQSVSDLALGVDGKNLFAATAHGIYRLPGP